MNLGIALRIQIATLILVLGLPLAAAADSITRMYVDDTSGGQAIYAISAEVDATAETFGLFRSADRGNTWSPVPDIPSPDGEPAVVTAVTAKIDIELNHYLFAATQDHGVFRSTDRGQTWVAWNDGSFTVTELGSGGANVPVSAISADGFLYTSFDHGENWLLLNVFLDALSLDTYGQQAIVGSRNGDVFEIQNPAGSYRFVNPSALGGPVGFVGKTNAQVFAVVNHDDASGRRLHRGTGFDNRDWSEMRADGSTLNVTAFAAGNGFVFIVNEGPGNSFMVFDLDTETWETTTLPVADGIEHIAIDLCNSVDCVPEVFMSTTVGGFRSGDAGRTWTVLGELVPTIPPPTVIAESDLGVYMVSPSTVNGAIMNTTSRFELEVTNHGPDRVEDVRVGFDFVTWRDGSTRGSSTFGTSLQINGAACSRDADWLLFPDMIAQCELDALEPGESARIVWIHALPTDAFSMRLEAKVDSHKVVDPHPNNDRLDFSPNVRSIDDIPGGSGGGGSTGFLTLLALLVVGRRRRRRRCMIE